VWWEEVVVPPAVVGLLGVCGILECGEKRGEWIWFVGEREREGQVLVLELRFMPCETRTELWRIVARARRPEALGPCVHGYVT